jgi:hypothetical protein
MTMFALLLMMAQAPVAPVAPPPPPRDQVAFDIQCMIASQFASDKVDGAPKAAMELAVMYYFGRVDAVLSGAALETRLEEEGKAVEGKQLAPLLKSCGEFMQVHGKTLQDVGAKLQARENGVQLR